MHTMSYYDCRQRPVRVNPIRPYRRRPTKGSKAVLQARFERIFNAKTGFVTLDRLLVRLHKKKSELLVVLDRPEIPPHTNGSENDIRARVNWRKVSAGTRSDIGRDCRDSLLGLAKTCAKLKLPFWDYVADRPGVPGCRDIPPLPELILASARSCRGFCPTHSDCV
jgi:hypothetical protein